MISRLPLVASAFFFASRCQNAWSFSTTLSDRQKSIEPAGLLNVQRSYAKKNGAFAPVAESSRLSSSTSLAMGLDEFLTGRDDKTRKADNDKYIAGLQKRVDKINGLESEIEELGDDELTAKTKEFQDRLKSGEDINGSLLEEAFAVVREAAW